MREDCKVKKQIIRELSAAKLQTEAEIVGVSVAAGATEPAFAGYQAPRRP